MSCLARFWRWANFCEFYQTCPLYREGAVTCENGGGDYCGKYMDLKYGRVKK